MYSLIAWPVLSLGVASVIFAVFEQNSVRLWFGFLTMSSLSSVSPASQPRTAITDTSNQVSSDFCSSPSPSAAVFCLLPVRFQCLCSSLCTVSHHPSPRIKSGGFVGSSAAGGAAAPFSRNGECLWRKAGRVYKHGSFHGSLVGRPL